MTTTVDHSNDLRYTTHGALHVPAGEGPTTWFSGDTYTIKASGESTGGALGLDDERFKAHATARDKARTF